MAFTNRTMNLGRLSELRHKLRELKIQIDVNVKGMVIHFEPMDADMDYVLDIDPMRLRIYVHDIEERMKQLRKVQAEMERINGEIGNNDNVE